jgi:hypothetical protein
MKILKTFGNDQKFQEKEEKNSGKKAENLHYFKMVCPYFEAPYNLDDIVQSRNWRKKEKRCLDELLDLCGDIVHLGSVCYV